MFFSSLLLVITMDFSQISLKILQKSVRNRIIRRLTLCNVNFHIIRKTMKLSKTFLFITALCCATPTLAIQNSTSSSGEQKMAMENTQNIREIYLAGGCFWGMEAYMERIHGVKDAIFWLCQW